MDVIGPEERWLEVMVEDEEGNPVLNTISAIGTNVLLFFLVFGLSATVEVKSLRKQLTNKAAIFTGVAMQFIIMPVLGFAAVCMMRHSSDFTQPMAITLLVVTASPGGSFSNWWCSLFNADLALSVAMTSVSSLLSVGLLPANLVLYSWLAFVVVSPNGQDIDILDAIDLETIFISLGVVMSAIILGLYAGFVFSSARFHKMANKFGTVCGMLLILFSGFLGSGGGGGKANFWSLHWSFYVATAFPCVAGMLLANVISRGVKLSHPETVAISIECCYQNTAIATSVAATMFSDPTTRTQAISVPLFYGLVEAFLIAIYCVWAWKLGWTKAPANEKLCVVMTRTYEIQDDVIEWQSEAQEAGWFARLFIPKETEESMLQARNSTNLSAGLGKNGRNSRKRFDSSDVTVATQRSRIDSTDTLTIFDGTIQTKIVEEPEDLESIRKDLAKKLEPLSEENAEISMSDLQRGSDTSLLDNSDRGISVSAEISMNSGMVQSVFDDERPMSPR